MIFSSSGIVLRSVKYGDTSVVVTIYTNIFGIQSYIINGVRTATKQSKAHLYQPASILDMQVYHNQFKNLQRVKEAKWKFVYATVFTDVIKNSIALFMVELLQKSILAEEQNEVLYAFLEGAFVDLDRADSAEAADMPIKFMLKLPSFFGFEIENNYTGQFPFFDPREGKFTANDQEPQIEHDALINQSLSEVLRSLSRGGTGLQLNGALRRSLLHLLETYYQYHVEGFKELKTLRVLEMLMKA